MSSSEDQSFGFYDESSKDWDQIAFNSPNYLMVKSAGNDRNDPGPSSGTRHCHYNSNGNSGSGFYYSSDSHPQDGGVTGYDTIAGGSASGKNIITVGATYDINGGYSTAGGVSLATFSGAGPTDDGRIKPDIVANGISLYSSTAGRNNQYGNYSGTSMSSPNVAGSLGLLGQHAENLYGTGFRFRAATHKALILHTADEAGASAGPDYMYGWGLMNTSSAAQLMTADANSSGPGNLYELQLNNSEEISIIVYSDGLSPLKATIAWTDPPGTPPANVVDPTTLMLVNDLDLRISNNSSTVFQPWVLQPASPASAATTGDNFRDNIEQVVVASPTEGWYLMTINHKGTLKDSSAQAFSVVVSGNVVLPLDLDLDSIPNTFEEDYGLDPLDPNDALLDPDNDGLTNLEEFELETDPGDPDSDDDLIIDGLDRLPNFDDALDTCTSPDAGLSIPIFNTVTCAASHSITTEGIAGVGGNETDGYGDLLMISPVVNFTPGFYVAPGGTLSVISENPNPLP